MEVLLQMVSCIGAGVVLMLGSIPGLAYQSKYHKMLYTGSYWDISVSQESYAIGLYNSHILL